MKKKKNVLWVVLSIVFTLFFLITLIGGPIANNYSQIINMVLGVEGSKVIGDEGITYFEPDYTSDQQVEEGQKVVENVVANGAVLLMNKDNALPLKSGDKITLASINSSKFVYGGTGSGGMNTDGVDSLKDALEKDGFEVNPTMWSFYTEGAGKEYGRILASGSLNNYIFENSEFKVNEVPVSKYSSNEWDSIKSYGDAAVVVFSRVCGEGADLPWYGAGDADGNILQLSKDEKDLLAKLSELKANGSLKKIVVLLNAANAIELDFLNPDICGVDYGIDACMWIGEVGQGISAVGELLNGTVNPSGKLVDTYCYDNLTSPALQNAHATSYTNSKSKGLSFSEGNNEYYVAYQEGIYVGYRYYETRYEDVVMGTENVGEYDYASTVAYPFGYGLSYSDISYESIAMEEDGDNLKFTVNVSNSSNVDGREAVQIYMQSPYTDYDRLNGVEKASVELVGFTKVDVPAGGSAVAEITVPKTELRAYDANTAGTYILDAGDYYFTSANGSHEALNNILAAKDYTVENGMTSDGNREMVCQYNVAVQDNTVFATAITGNEIQNQLDHADLNRREGNNGDGIVYLTRSDWEGTMPVANITNGNYEAAYKMSASDDMVAQMNEVYTKNTDGEMPVVGKEGNLNLAQFVGVPIDGSIEIDGKTYTWDDLVDQVSFNEMAKLIGQTYHSTAPVASVSKPATKDENGPQGITATLTGGGSSTSYTSEDLMAASFDAEVATAVGRSMGNDCLLANGKAYSGIYGPGVNIHRTPYSGRNFEYYSEDPFISGKICAAEVSGIQSKGVYVYMKHFALNDQETARDGICVWTNEQAARELYLQAFEYPVVEASAYCVMTGFNRLGCVWAGGDYGLITGILRGEWGMPGFVLTDFSNNNNYMDVLNGLMAGGDGWDCNDGAKWTQKLVEYKDDPTVVAAMKEATKHILYTTANSNAMNGVSANMQVVEVVTWWQILIIVLDVVFGILAAFSIFMLVRSIKKNK
ncbi:glycoside hydrolase family 3 C-terminal domain-containing protein [Butyrivibrio sp. AE2015]|uniref:glycoside hydrolase family 3 C-terminal domain-containing protein n=1 Tax=Butyrivibrio sp. AE2015 TaxID=1280663 RepID=UPI0003B52428|nr:glycoside hydrolase family 3 C-terminal domain-containing protein [Butyrivibrio sp. AE2015]